MSPDQHVVDHAARAADHVLALVRAQDPAYPVTAESHDRLVELVESIVRLLAMGGQR